jgi:acetolactate synthase-1/2/3 large subunit
VFVIGNDAGRGGIRNPQTEIYGAGAEIATSLAPSRYDWLCEIFGGHSEHVDKPDDLRPALERALASGGPAIVNVILDPDAMTNGNVSTGT